MISKQDLSLALKAAEVARLSPRIWSEFLEELKKYADRVKDQCVNAPPEHMMVAQGRARESASLLCMFHDCVKVADDYARSQQAKTK